MESLRFFRRTYKDPVVEYYFLPWRDDIRLTRRFGLVYVHVRLLDHLTQNSVWSKLVEASDLKSGEQYVMSTIANHNPKSELQSFGFQMMADSLCCMVIDHLH